MLICDQCGSELESQGLLVAHVKKHVTTTCYSCEDCNHEFISKADFGSHLKNVHASTRCTSEVCDDKFISKKDLKEHIEKVHARKVIACEYCEQIYQPSGAGGTRSPPSTPHRLQNPKWRPGGPKMADVVWKGV